MIVEQFLCRSDNIALLLHDKASKDSIAVDAPDGPALLTALQKAGRRLAAVLVTHHHHDHTEGLALLKRATGAKIFGPALEAAQISPLDTGLQNEQKFTCGAFSFEVIATPGHTLGEICYYLPQQKLVFTGDCLFSLGCGRIFEGDAAMMYHSLQKLAALPPQTQIYCGHEYSAANARFALTIEPHNPALQQRAAEIRALRAAGKITLPATLSRELAANPFLRCDSAEIRTNLACAADETDVQLFAKLRQLKDRFR
ncbi:MAG: hydroxyacylglutathione hydrolase [Candidatus Tokpelaia sp.]|nr:MAG: hydroxyacylglutathione hydrolase [Candidatus Tokpelaia sp.]KAA6206184.1 MAG: hydroxyacylglutathione hydrolase [Candidatus Tokpelaia sp.]